MNIYSWYLHLYIKSKLFFGNNDQLYIYTYRHSFRLVQSSGELGLVGALGKTKIREVPPAPTMRPRPALTKAGLDF